MDFPLRVVLLGWNFYECVVLVRNALGKNFSPIRHIGSNFQLIYGPFMASRRIVITLSEEEVQRSDWFQIKATLVDSHSQSHWWVPWKMRTPWWIPRESPLFSPASPHGDFFRESLVFGRRKKKTNSPGSPP
jgi:hypothetical protein